MIDFYCNGSELGPCALYSKVKRKWIFGLVLLIQTHGQTFKDRATQLMRSKSGALVMQLHQR